jgi:hypothetical protein
MTMATNKAHNKDLALIVTRSTHQSTFLGIRKQQLTDAD